MLYGLKTFVCFIKDIKCPFPFTSFQNYWKDLNVQVVFYSHLKGEVIVCGVKRLDKYRLTALTYFKTIQETHIFKL